MKEAAITLFILACLTACVSLPEPEPPPPPRYEDYTGQDAACVEGFHSFFGPMTGQPSVAILSIDGTKTQGPSLPACVTPGKHLLEIRALRTSWVAVSATKVVVLEFQAGRKYQLRANFRDDSFVLQFIDITSAPGNKMTEFILTDIDILTVPFPHF